MEFQFLVIILVIILIYLIYTSSVNETFDVLEKDITKQQCGRICTKSPSCKAFAFDETTKDCYLSKENILGAPNFGLHLNKYKPEQMRCNKVRPIGGDEGVIAELPNVILRDNTLYLCSQTEDADYKFYQIVNEKMEEVDKKNINNLPDEVYELKDIDWSNKDKDYTKTDILIPLDKEKERLQPLKLFHKDNREYLGQYLFPHRCVSDVSEGECLRFCQNNQHCVGTEWNSVYMEEKGGEKNKNKEDNSIIIHRNVCCPKTQIREIIERRKEFKNGNFYLKNTQDDDINKDKKNIYVSIDKLGYK